MSAISTCSVGSFDVPDAVQVDDAPVSRAPLHAAIDRQRGQLLTRRQERELGRLVQSGSRHARDELVERNLRLVIRLAQQARGEDGRELMDRVQDGVIGLIRAAEKFDPERGFRFSTYATWWIRQAISRRQWAQMRVPAELTRQVHVQTNRLHQQLRRMPTVAELADAVGVPEELIASAQAAMQPARLDDAAGDDDSSATLGELTADARAVDPIDPIVERDARQEQRALIAMYLEQLDHASRRLIELRYGIDDDTPLTLAQAAHVLGLSINEARRLEGAAMHRLHQIAGGDDHQIVDGDREPTELMAACMVEEGRAMLASLPETIRAAASACLLPPLIASRLTELE